ncbi:MAG: hypothetical protein MK132_07335 [Lentisphaerales bacterium]|nr:hypothetical protein [Lentisphaerales bacterium]
MWFTLAQLPKPPKMPKMPAEVKAWQKAWNEVSSSPLFQYALYIVGFIAIALLIRFLWKRWKARNANAAPQAITLTAKELISSWRDFLQAIPGDFRRSILHYKPFIVMGGSSSGKTQLIDKYTNWKGMARQFYPSYNSNSKLQFYLGTQSLIQEVSLPILEDSSKPARRALKKLWRKTFAKSEPVVVLVVPVNKLDNSSVDILRKQAQLLRGKINVIAWERKASVKTRIALTHMDSIEGYAEFCKLLSDNNIPLNLNLKDYSTNSLSTALEPYEKHLSLALTTMSSTEYLKIISFFQEAPKQLARIETFVKALCMVEPLSPVPDLQEIIFTSNLDSDKLCIPFKVSATECIINRWTYRKHQLYAAASFAILFGYGALGYYLENRRLDSIEAHLNSFEKRLLLEDDVQIKILKERFNELDIRKDWLETVLFPEDLRKEKDHLENDLKPFLEQERQLLNNFPELNYFPPFFKQRTAEMHKLLKKEVDHLEEDISKTDQLITALEDKQKTWVEYERKQRVKIYRTKVLKPLLDEINHSEGKVLEEIYALFALYAHKNRVEDLPFQGKEIKQTSLSNYKGNLLYNEIRNNISRWVEILDLDQEAHYAVLSDYMFRKEKFLNPNTETYNYRFKDYLNEVYEPWFNNIILEDKKVLSKGKESSGTDIVVEFYEILNKYTEEHDYITKSDLHRFRKLDKDLTIFKDNLDERKEWLDLNEIYMEQKKILAARSKQADAVEKKLNKELEKGDYLPSLPREWVLDVIEREELNQPDYVLFLEEIQNTDLHFKDVSQMTFPEFMVTLHRYKDQHKINVLTFELDNHECTFDLNKWNQMIVHSKLQLMIEAYAKARGNHGYKIFFDNENDHDNYESIELTQISNGSFLFSGKSFIPGQFTKEAFEYTVKPAIEEYLKFEKALEDQNLVNIKKDDKEKIEHYKLRPSTKRILKNLVKNAIHDYAEKYSDSMTRFASALNVKATSEADLKFILQQMQKSSSTFGVFLKKLYTNTTIELKDSIYQPIADQLGKFKYIKAIMREEEGELPELQAYYGILEMMQKELNGEFINNADNSQLPPENQTPQKQVTGDNGIPQLGKQLSPMGKMTLNIFEGQSSSYYLRIKQWLDAVNMPNERALRAPFYAPAVSAYRLGATELERQVSANWDLLLQKVLVPMSQHFPFDKAAHKSISPDEVTSLLGIEGGFWRYFESMLGATAALYNNKWQKTSVTSIVQLPPSMLPTLNRLQKLNTTLWNQKGQNKPIVMKVNAGLLPDAGVVYHIFDSLPVLAYMNAGDSSVMAFNQRPQWQDIKVDWWRPHVARIGIQFSTLDEETSVFSALNTGEKDWGLLHLLSQGNEVSDSSWVWNVDIDTAMQTVDHEGYAQLTANGPMNKMPVRFRFDKSLMDIFNLSLSWSVQNKINIDLRKMHVPTWNKKTHGNVDDAAKGASPYHTPDQIKEIFGTTEEKDPLALPKLNEEKAGSSF